VHIHRTVYRDDHELLRASARRFFERVCVPRQAQWDADGQVDRDTWLAAGREGLQCDMVVAVCKTDPAAGAKGVSLIVVETSRTGFADMRVSRIFGGTSEVLRDLIARKL
jgi:alkylation response protein AidB-like acyl-CoA dehydrogenase